MSLFNDLTKRPLADRVRPTTLAEYIGQEEAVGPGSVVRSMIEHGHLVSLILWGPPGTGKTTLARLIAGTGDYAFTEISAVTSGLAEVKKVIEAAARRRELGQATILFVDEIHRFNKAQQDAFLPHVENGTIILIGATTENPSFEVIGPLLSRSRIITLTKLTDAHISQVLNRGLAELVGQQLANEARQLLIQIAGGDARVALTSLEAAAGLANGTISREHVKQAVGTPTARYDKAGEYHFNLISAYIKSLRAGAVDAAMYYLARMLEGGEDPKFIARRLVIFASEDIGVAASPALNLAVSTFMAVERVGLPEGRINLAHATAALAAAPKDRRAYDALNRATEAAKRYPGAEVPIHLRNASTQLMGELGYGEGYHWKAGFSHPRGYLPPELENQTFFDTTPPPKPH